MMDRDPRRQDATGGAKGPGRTLLLALAGAGLFLLGGCGGGDSVPTPLAHFGFEPGEDRRLANWEELLSYYDEVARASPRVAIDTLGLTTEGRPFVMLTITSPENHDRLEEFRDVNLRLADPRALSGSAELEDLLDRGRVVVLLTNHIHSTEVASGQMPALLTHRLATSDHPEVREVLENAVVLHIPSLNPDGTELIANWWRRWAGTEYEGAPLTRLYHFYVGHDNNRDWYALTQRETRHTVLHAHNAWRPQITHDMHGRGSYSAARFYTTPYIDPIDDNVDPLLIAASNQAGTFVAKRMLREGMEGVVVNANYDAWTPARAYQHYHGGARILSETARSEGPAPVTLGPEDLDGRRGYDAHDRSWNYPAPWPGGEWRLADQVRYMKTGAFAVLLNAARNRRDWLENFHEVHRRAVDRWDEWPHAWVVPQEGADPLGLQSALRILTTGLVEVHRSLEPVQVGDREFPEGTYVIPMDQPYASFVQTLIGRTQYRAARWYLPGGPEVRPRRATAHDLPLLMSFEAVAGEEPLDVALSDPLPIQEVDFPDPAAFLGPDPPRIGVYKGWREERAGGWTRWVFDQHGLPYDTLHDADVRRGDLADRYDVILFQDLQADRIIEGHPEGVLPEEYTGGLGPEGVAAVRRFVEAGGRLVAVDRATDFVIEALDLGVRNAVAGLDPDEFYIGAALLRLRLTDRNHYVNRGVPEHTIAWFHGRGDQPPPWSRAFAVQDPRVRVLARYGDDEPLLQGWALGMDRVADQPALLEADVGAGSVILFGFQPNYRGHSVATWPMLFNALGGPEGARYVAVVREE